MTDHAGRHDDQGLRAGAVGFGGVLFQSITFMAPAIATALSIPAGIVFSGGGAPLSVIFALIASLIAANSIGQLSRHMPSAGSFYTYVSNGIHPVAGFLVGWGFLLGIIIGGPFLALQMGFIVGNTFNSEWGWSTNLWWIWTLIVSILVLLLGYRGIKASTGIGMLLGAFEIVIFAAISITLIVQAGGRQHAPGLRHALCQQLQLLRPVGSHRRVGVHGSRVHRVRGGGADRGGGTRATPAIHRAIMLSCLGIGLFYILNTYASTIAFGPLKMTGFVSAGDSNPWQNLLARQAWGTAGFVLVFLALVNSVIANQNAANNSSTRTMFSMGRIRLLPTAYGSLTRGSPLVALVTQFVVTVGVSLWLGFQYDPYTGFVLTATILVDIFAPMYVLLNVACLLYFWRYRRDEFNWLLHGVLPVLGALAFIPAFCAGAGIPLFSFICTLPKPLSYAGPAAAIWMAIGVVYLIVLLATRPARITETKRVFVED